MTAPASPSSIVEQLAASLTRDPAAPLPRQAHDVLELLRSHCDATCGWLRYRPVEPDNGIVQAAAPEAGWQATLTAEEEDELLERHGGVTIFRLPQDVPEPLAKRWRGLRHLIVAPLATASHSTGTLALLFKGQEPSRAAADLKAVAPLLTVALHQARELQLLLQNQEQTLRILGLSLEYRDCETSGHTDRIAQLCEELGAVLGLDETQMHDLRWGAYIHDIGKIAISDSMLKRPAALTREEWEIMQSHTKVGEKFARQLGFVSQAAIEVVRHHHEWYNGTGYPDGLEGDDIPLLAQIFALVDVYDALTTARPYSQARTPVAAIEEIESQIGTHFHPAVGEKFVDFIAARHNLVKNPES